LLNHPFLDELGARGNVLSGGWTPADGRSTRLGGLTVRQDACCGGEERALCPLPTRLKAVLIEHVFGSLADELTADGCPHRPQFRAAAG
jgi:hypothetical protein